MTRRDSHRTQTGSSDPEFDRLERAFEELRSEPVEGHFAEVASTLRREHARLRSRQAGAERGWSRPRAPGWLTPRLAVASLACVFIVGACQIPTTLDETVGFVVSGVLDGRSEDAAKAVTSLPWLNKDDLTVSGVVMRPGSGDFGLKFAVVLWEALASEAEVRRRELEAIPGVDAVEVSPIEVPVERPVYQAVLRGIDGSLWRTKVELGTELEARSEARIVALIDSLAIDGLEADLVNGPDGSVSVNLSAPTAVLLDKSANEELNRLLSESSGSRRRE